MENNIDRTERRRKNRITAGVLLVAAGTLYLFNQLNLIFVPFWLFSWPMLLIVAGLVSGFRHNFRNPGWFAMTMVGSAFLFNMIFPAIGVVVLWPFILIALGVRMLFFRESRWCQERWARRQEWKRDMHFKADPTSL